MTTASAAELNRQFGIPGAANVTTGNENLVKVAVNTAAASGEIYLHGAHVTSWKPAGAQEVFFLSPRSAWQEGKAIRGGVPICFPWFGDKAGDPHAPAHGFVRTKAWQLEGIERHGDAVAVSIFTESDDSTKRWWPADFRLVHRVTFAKTLTQELILTNTGPQPLRFEEALHTYYSVGDAAKARISGLDGTEYLDKTDSFRQKKQTGDVMIERETDRVYLNTANPLELSDPVLQRRISITKTKSLTTVIWNPVDKAQTLSDLGEDQWRRMLCIEVTNVGEFAVELRPGEQHTMSAEVRLF